MKLGILGNGQLGRMAALAAARLGVESVIYAPDADGPANHVVRQSFAEAYNDEASLSQFAKSVDAVTYEFENVPVATARFIETLKPIFPQPIWLERAQHRLREKEFIRSKNIPTAPYCVFDPAMRGHVADRDVIIKTCAGGYDGKGQWSVARGAIYPLDLPDVDLIVEDKINLRGEVSVIICADQHGARGFYDPSWNEHVGGILRRSIVPAPDVSQSKIIAIAEKLIEGESFVGVMALELFITKDGQILANEIAPRPHNSGHWTIDACVCSQFEQQARAALGLPLGRTARHSDAQMVNLIGDEGQSIAALLNDAQTGWKADDFCVVHLYGKANAMPGRKMGHITSISPKSA